MAKAKQAPVEQNVVVLKPITARNEVQKAHMKNMKEKPVSIFVAPAGCGKSFLTVNQALLMLDRGEINKIVITRPNVLMGRSLGALKGELQDKFSPLVAELLTVMEDTMGRDWLEKAIEEGRVVMSPLEYIRGRSLKDFTIVDEAQLTNPDEMYTICTRLADGGKMVFLGDPTQKDQKGFDGISWLLDFVKRHGGEDLVGHVEGTSEYIERGAFCKWAVQSREKDIEQGYEYKGD